MQAMQGVGFESVVVFDTLCVWLFGPLTVCPLHLGGSLADLFRPWDPLSLCRSALHVPPAAHSIGPREWYTMPHLENHGCCVPCTQVLAGMKAATAIEGAPTPRLRPISIPSSSDDDLTGVQRLAPPPERRDSSSSDDGSAPAATAAAANGAGRSGAGRCDADSSGISADSSSTSSAALPAAPTHAAPALHASTSGSLVRSSTGSFDSSGAARDATVGETCDGGGEGEPPPSRRARDGRLARQRNPFLAAGGSGHGCSSEGEGAAGMTGATGAEHGATPPPPLPGAAWLAESSGQCAADPGASPPTLPPPSLPALRPRPGAAAAAPTRRAHAPGSASLSPAALAAAASASFHWLKLLQLTLLWMSFLGLSALDALLPLCSWKYAAYLAGFLGLTLLVTGVFVRAIFVRPALSGGGDGWGDEEDEEQWEAEEEAGDEEAGGGWFGRGGARRGLRRPLLGGRGGMAGIGECEPHACAAVCVQCLWVLLTRPAVLRPFS